FCSYRSRAISVCVLRNDSSARMTTPLWTTRPDSSYGAGTRRGLSAIERIENYASLGYRGSGDPGGSVGRRRYERKHRRAKNKKCTNELRATETTLPSTLP